MDDSDSGNYADCVVAIAATAVLAVIILMALFLPPNLTVTVVLVAFLVSAALILA
jgi:beta-lactam-binding protein with PASTA domain